MKTPKQATNKPSPPLTAHVISEELAKQRFGKLLVAEHNLGSRQPKRSSLYQVACRGVTWVGLLMSTAAIWHVKSRDQRIGWDPVMRSERLQLVVHQSRFCLIGAHREPNLASHDERASSRPAARIPRSPPKPPVLSSRFAQGYSIISVKPLCGRAHGTRTVLTPPSEPPSTRGSVKVAFKLEEVQVPPLSRIVVIDRTWPLGGGVWKPRPGGVAQMDVELLLLMGKLHEARFPRSSFRAQAHLENRVRVHAPCLSHKSWGSTRRNVSQGGGVGAGFGAAPHSFYPILIHTKSQRT